MKTNQDRVREERGSTTWLTGRLSKGCKVLCLCNLKHCINVRLKVFKIGELSPRSSLELCCCPSQPQLRFLSHRFFKVFELSKGRPHLQTLIRCKKRLYYSSKRGLIWLWKHMFELYISGMIWIRRVCSRTHQ